MPLFTLLAHAGQVHSEMLTVEQVTQSAHAAVVIELARPATIAVAVPVPGGEGKDCGTYPSTCQEMRCAR
jgi:hypothetical protein